MSQADSLQNAHCVPDALLVRLEVIRAGTADWREYHQAGVLVSELAHSAWYIGFRGWHARCEYLLQKSFDSFFAKARQLVPHDAGRALAHQAIDCDEAMALARLTRVTPVNPDLLMNRATILLDGVVNDLCPNGVLPRDDALLHQLGIAYSFLAQLAWGLHLGYSGHSDVETAKEYQRKARECFGAERLSVDDMQAARSLIIAMSLGYYAAGDRRQHKEYARRAWRLASACGDQSHLRRASFILWFGSRGERWLRRRRDGGSVKTLTL